MTSNKDFTLLKQKILTFLARREHLSKELALKICSQKNSSFCAEEVFECLELLANKGLYNERKAFDSLAIHHLKKGEGPEKIFFKLSPFCREKFSVFHIRALAKTLELENERPVWSKSLEKYCRKQQIYEKITLSTQELLKMQHHLWQKGHGKISFYDLEDFFRSQNNQLNQKE